MRKSPSIRRYLALALLGTSALLHGCAESNEPKMVEAPPPPPPTEAEKKPAGKPEGYGANKAYEDAMEKQFGGKR